MITFDGQVLSNASPYKNNRGITVKETVLLSGEIHVRAAPTKKFTPSFTCQTEDENELKILDLKVGLAKTLVIDGVSYENCTMTAFESEEYYPGKYEYTITFTQAVANPDDDDDDDGGDTPTPGPIPIEETINVFSSEPLAVLGSKQASPVPLKGKNYANIYVTNGGASTNLVVEGFASNDQFGTVLIPVFVCTLGTTVSSSGASLLAPSNFLIIKAINNDSVNATTVSVAVSVVSYQTT